MKYLRLFETQSDFEDAIENDELECLNVSYIMDNDETSGSDDDSEDGPMTYSYNCYSEKYLTFEALEEGTFTLTIPAGINSINMSSVSYSLDGENWVTTNVDNTDQTITTPTIAKGNTVFWKGSGISLGNSSYSSTFSSTGKFNVYNNIMSLFYSDNFKNQTTFTAKQYCFKRLFYGSTTLINAENLILPATTLQNYCYAYMFYNCTSLKTTPSLPATTLANYCYSNMFYNCTGLTTTPALPATTLQSYCYQQMFYNCTSLTTTPELPATTLASYCYSSMFGYCTSLTTAPELPATTLATWCYQSMFRNCTSLRTVPSNMLPATTLANYCYSGMFEDCTGLTTTPELPATTLASNCYSYMFRGCTGLTTAPELPATTLTSQCYYYMFYGCSNLNYIKAMFTTTPGSYTTNWVQGVAATGTFVKNFAASWNVNGNNGVPTGWTVTSESWPDNYDYFTTEAINDSVFTLTIGSSVSPTDLKYVEYSTDNGSTWTRTNNVASTAVTVTTPSISAGNKVLWRSLATTYSNGHSANFWSAFSSTANYSVSGNIHSLIGCATNLLGGGAFRSLFYNSRNLISAANLILPATTLTSNCYKNMFYNCTSLTTAPALNAITLAQSCYESMFQGCASLTTAPALNATTMQTYCYQYMFNGCTSLTTAPELPATTLAQSCYCQMFSGCTSLTTAPELPATTLAHGCYSYMFNGCTALTTAPELPATTLVTDCYYSMFNGCTALTTAPELLATTLVTDCYQEMFYGCRNLNHIKCMAENPSSSYTSNWVYNVAATGTFIKRATINWTTGVSGIPSGWVVENEWSNNFDFFTTEAIDNCQFSLSIPAAIGTDKISSISYSTDNKQTWVETNNSSSAVTITTPTVTAGNKVYWRGIATAMATSSSNYSYFSSTGRYNVSGNVISLIGSKGTTTSSYVFLRLFKETSVVNACDLVLPSSTISQSCYYEMFSGCTSLTTAPELPATTLVTECYCDMFMGCTSLITAPALPATTLASYCYSYMFSGCTSLTTAPTLNATTLQTYCYQGMFEGCTSLTSAPTLSATTLASYCYSGMFKGCTGLTTAPELPATTLVTNCYGYMFHGCRRLNYIKALFTTTPDSSYTNNWVYGVASTGTFVKNRNASWNVVGTNGVPNGWTIETNGDGYIMSMWVDDFPGIGQANYAVEEPEESGANKYIYNGRTITYNGGSYYLWEEDLGNGAIPYLLTSSINYNTLRNQSIAYNGIEADFTSLVAFLTNDNGTTYSRSASKVSETKLVATYNDSDLEIWIDDFRALPTQDFIDDPAGMGSNQYGYFGDTFTYNGNTYYVWEDLLETGAPPALLTTTVNEATLRNQSLEESGLETTFDAFFATLDSNNQIGYTTEDYYGQDIRLIKLEGSGSNDPIMEMWVDDFPEDEPGYYDGEPIEDMKDRAVDDPEGSGANLYIFYGDTMTHNGNTYYVWENPYGVSPDILLTTTNNFATLDDESIETSGYNAEFTSLYGRLSSEDDYEVIPDEDQQLITVYEY